MNGRLLWLSAILAACAGEVAEAPLPPMPDYAQTNRLAHGQFERAYARVATTANAPDGLRASVLGELADLFHAYERSDDALVLYDRALALEPHNGDWLYYRAVILERRGDLDEAIAAWRRLSQLEPENAGVRTRLARTLDRSGDAAAAGREFEVVLTLDPKSAEAVAHLAEREIGRGDFEAAIRRLETARSSLPESRILAFALGRAYAAAGRKREAKPLLDAASEHSIDPRPRGTTDKRLVRLQALRRSPLAHERRGHVALDRGDWMVAIAEFRQALALDPKREAVRHNLAIAQLRAGRLQEAKRSLEENLVGADVFVPSAVLLASLVADEGDLERAAALLERAEAAAPESSLVKVARGQIERTTGETAAAAVLLEAAVKATPSQAAGWLELVVTYLQAGRASDAAGAIERFALSLPEDPTIEPLSWRQLALAGSAPACRQRVEAAPGRTRQVSEFESWVLLLACAGRWEAATELQARVVDGLPQDSAMGQVARRRLARLRTRQGVPRVWMPVERWSRVPLRERNEGPAT